MNNDESIVVSFMDAHSSVNKFYHFDANVEELIQGFLECLLGAGYSFYKSPEKLAEAAMMANFDEVDHDDDDDDLIEDLDTPDLFEGTDDESAPDDQD